MSAATIVAICGSTRFRAAIAEANRMLTLSGHLVLAPGVFAHDGDAITEEQKTALDRLHLQKIDLASWIYVVNPGGYIGESTSREIDYAKRTGKGVLALVDVGIDGWSPEAQAKAAVAMAAKREAFRNRRSAMTFRCQARRDPSADQCTGVIRISPDEIQAACPVCSTWHGRDLAPDTNRQDL